MSFDRIAPSPRTQAAYARFVAIPVALLIVTFGWIAYMVLPTGPIGAHADTGVQQKRDTAASPAQRPEGTTVTAADAS